MSTHVHNADLLTRAETGLLGLVGLLSPLVLAAAAIFARRKHCAKSAGASGLAIAAAALHSQFE